MKVIWMPQAKNQFRQTAKYIRMEFGQKAMDNFIQHIREANHLLENNPNIGKTEPLLEDDPILYRSYVVSHLNKLIYCIVDDHIEVYDLWDVRREPRALVDRVAPQSIKG